MKKIYEYLHEEIEDVILSMVEYLMGEHPFDYGIRYNGKAIEFFGNVASRIDYRMDGSDFLTSNARLQTLHDLDRCLEILSCDKNMQESELKIRIEELVEHIKSQKRNSY